ncbi:MAG: ATP-binding protein [Thermodesulfobacteriota bacterium]
MILAVASGKGGTGKTTVATNLARCLGSRAQLIDCDVEEPNAHLFLKPVIERVSEVTLPIPEVDLSRCTYCGQCSEFCRFSAIVVVGRQLLSFPEMCHGCGGCSLVCPEKAIGESPRVLGVLEEGVADGVAFVHGRLRVGEAMSPPLIRAARRRAMADRTVILDAPPGTSCPVITAVRDTDYCVMVTEPTPFGINDLMLAVEVVRSLGIPHGVVVNRSDLDSEELHELCRKEGLHILLEIPEDRRIAEAYSKGQMIVDVYPEYRWDFLNLFQRVRIDLAKAKARRGRLRTNAGDETCPRNSS